MTFTCDICNTKVTNKSNLEKHKKTETCKRIKKDLEYDQKIKKLEEENKSLNIENILLKDENKLLTEKIKTLKEKSEEYRSIVEKAAIKSTTTVNNNSKNTYNNNLQYISSEPIKWNEIPKMLSEVVNVDTVCYDENDFNDHIIDNILKDENGNDKVLCTDINRKNFSYKDELSGELISDPELEKLREKLRNGVDIKIVRHELLYKLLEKYRDRPDIDPYEKLCYFLEKLEFGDPFVVQVAKKTYIKSKLPLSIE